MSDREPFPAAPPKAVTVSDATIPTEAQVASGQADVRVLTMGDPTETRQVRDLPKIHALPIREVRESTKNARKIPEQAVTLVARSIERFGWKQPLVVDKDRNLIAGHTRYRAARALGLTRVPAIIADDLTPAEVDAYRIADNRTHDFTSWDLPELAQQLAELDAEFADVLALTDWEVASAQLEQATKDLATLDLPDGGATAFHEGGFIVKVLFHTKEDALAAQQALIDLPGAFDVRHDF